MVRRWSAPDAASESPATADWRVTVTEPLPACPSTHAGWARIATQSRWGEWRTESAMRGRDVVTTVVPPATEPLRVGDEYLVRIGRWMTIRCRVLESSSPDVPTGENDEMVFDAQGTAMAGMVRARFRFTIFRNESGMVMARAQENIVSLPFFVPSRDLLESEHRHTFRDLNESFRT